MCCDNRTHILSGHACILERLLNLIGQHHLRALQGAFPFCHRFAEYIYECEALIGPVAWGLCRFTDLRLVCQDLF
jgi:hypothetical protein